MSDDPEQPAPTEVATGASLTTSRSGGEAAGIPPAEPGSTVDGRYRLHALLGEGGMGRVYRAFDLLLQREVALKVMRHPDARASERLLREARAQGRVVHDNVCRVYDAGEVEGRAFVSMQLLGGPSLREAARGLTLREKLEVVAQAAEGVHAAHRLGLVHRDLKPGNVMLERQPAGGWRAYVVDFGLVHELDAATSATHALVGTPHYMAPEQARGEMDRLDWRTDVWALGATLFELLLGTTPFPAASATEILVRVAAEDLRFPSTPRLPRDLRAILEHCLAREMEGRYGSARELADDLRRHLAGQPVLARPLGPAARGLRLARRHPRTTAATAAALVGLLALTAAWLATAARAQRRAELARRFGEEAAAVEAIARYSALLPPHDTRQERARVRDRIRAIEARAAELGELARGPSAYAVGRGWLALGEPDRARESLQRAWDAGHRGPDVAVALGQALAALYQRGLYEARGIASPDLRRSREQQLAQDLREEALARLREGAGATHTSPALVRAQLALVEERWDEALRETETAARQTPWLHEAVRLRGEIWLARAEAQTSRGETEAAATSLQSAEEAVARAVDLARSDPEARAADCQRRLLLLKAGARSGTSPRPLLAPLRQACRAAADLDTEAARAVADLGLGLVTLAEWQQAHGEDPAAILAEAESLARDAVARRPDEPRPHDLLGVVAWQQARDERKAGRDPRPASERALASFATATRLDPVSALPRANRGQVLSELAQDERNAGRDPLSLLGEARRAFDEALAIDPRLASALHSRGIVGFRAGEWATLHGFDARPHLRAAIRDFEAALAINPALAPTPNSLGATHRALATYLDTTGGDPVPEWRAAERWYEVAIARHPDDVNPRYNLAHLLRTLATLQIERGEDALPALEKARREAAEAVRIDGRDNRNHLQVGNVELLVAEAKVARGEDPAPAFSAAERAISRARSMNRADGVVWIAEARLHRLRARHLTASGRSGGEEIRRSLAAIDEAQRLIPTSGQTRQVRAELLLDLARASAGAARERAARRALAALQDALAQNPNLSGDVAELRRQVEEILAAPARTEKAPAVSPAG